MTGPIAKRIPATDPADFWSPEFEITARSDGSVLMSQKGELAAYLPLLADYLDKWADAAPDTCWLARRGDDGAWRRVSYAEAHQRARALGAGLLDLGLGPDRPLLILSENSIEHGLLGLACFYVGIPYAPVSPAYAQVSKDHGKLKNIAALLDPGAIFADDGAAFADAVAAIAAPGRHVINVRNPQHGALTMEALDGTPPEIADKARARLTPETVVKYLFTSGSTGSPKAVINTNAMITANQAMIRDCYRFHTKAPPVMVDWTPWNHTAGGNHNAYIALTNGGTLHIDDGRPLPGRFEETVRNLREIPCTWYFSMPLGFDMLADAMDQDPELARVFFSRTNMMCYAGAGLAQHTWDRLSAQARKVTGRDVLISAAFGATETAPFALGCTEIQDKAGNIGVAARGLVLKLVPAGGKLELRLKGPTMTPGYFKDPDKTAEVFDEEGFYRMGDAVRPADPDDLTRGFFFDGRIAENFKLLTGTWVAVGSVRTALVDAMGGLIRDAVIVGENEAELGALLVLSDHGAAMDAGERRSALIEALRTARDQATGSSTRVRRALVLEISPSFDRGELTEKGSLNQRAMRANNADLIGQLYAGTADDLLA